MSFLYKTATFTKADGSKPGKTGQTINESLKSGKLNSRESAAIDMNIEKNEAELRTALQNNIAKYEKFDNHNREAGQKLATAIKKANRKPTSLEESKLKMLAKQRKIAQAHIEAYNEQLFNLDCAQMVRGDIEIANKQAQVTKAQSQFMKKSSLTVGSASVTDMASIQLNTELVRQSASNLSSFHNDQTRDYIDNTIDEQQQRASNDADVDIDSLLDEFSCDIEPIRLTTTNNNNNDNNNNDGATDAEHKLIRAFDQL